MKGLLSNTVDWITHASYSEGTIGQWVAFVALVLLASFLWSRTIKIIAE